jgi:2-methylcitrate dehydratase PrpD
LEQEDFGLIKKRFLKSYNAEVQTQTAIEAVIDTIADLDNREMSELTRLFQNISIHEPVK